MSGNQASCGMRQLSCPLPSLFLLRLHFISFVVSLSFKSSLKQRFTMRSHSCRDSCSGVKYSHFVKVCIYRQQKYFKAEGKQWEKGGWRSGQWCRETRTIEEGNKKKTDKNNERRRETQALSSQRHYTVTTIASGMTFLWKDNNATITLLLSWRNGFFSLTLSVDCSFHHSD